MLLFFGLSRVLSQQFVFFLVGVAIRLWMFGEKLSKCNAVLINFNWNLAVLRSTCCRPCFDMFFFPVFAGFWRKHAGKSQLGSTLPQGMNCQMVRFYCIISKQELPFWKSWIVLYTS